MIFLLVFALLFFILLTWKNFNFGLVIFFALLPTYLIRFQFGSLPTTFLELLFFFLCIIWLIHFAKSSNKKNVWQKIINIPHRTLFFSALALFVIGATLGVVQAFNIRAALGEWRAFYIEPIILCFILVTSVNTKKEIDRIIGGLVLSGLAVSLLAIYQHFTGWLVPYSFWANRNTYRVTAWYGFPNAVGIYVGMIMPLLVYRGWVHIRQITNNRKQITFVALCYLFSVICYLLAIIYAKSAGAMVGLIAGLGTALLCFKKTRWPAVIVGATALLGFILIPNTNYTKKLILAETYSGQLRRDIWSETITYLKIHPLRGTGMASYAHEIAPFRHNKKIEVFHHPHNIFLTIWVNTGIVGLVGFLGILVWFFVSILKYQITDNKKQITLTTALVVTMAVWLVMGLVDSPYIKNDWSMIYWFYIALTCLLM